MSSPQEQTVVQITNALNVAESCGTKFKCMTEISGVADGEGIVYMLKPDAIALLRHFQGQSRLPLTDRHQIVVARELTAAAGYPLRDRYGYATNDEDVQSVVQIVLSARDQSAAAEEIGIGSGLGDLRIARGYDLPTDEEYEAGIVKALWSLRP